MAPVRPTDEQLLAAAGSARHSRLLIRGELAGLAVAVVDANGDDALYECVTLRRDGDRWVESSSGSAGLLAEGWADGVAYVYGRSPGVDVVQVGLHGQRLEARVNADGWWLVLAPATEDDHFDLSRVRDPFPHRRQPDDRPPRIAG